MRLARLGCGHSTLELRLRQFPPFVFLTQSNDLAHDMLLVRIFDVGKAFQHESTRSSHSFFICQKTRHAALYREQFIHDFVSREIYCVMQNGLALLSWRANSC
eukprot:Gregarina_sp_Pseudo_9__3463@NODE_362_length_3041_cov_3_336775_g341_i0_p4_GENE_NODE_362_length_3041_cov_3_336775_g341_i0NODE_362_length_3041_cov_3_336775_g341_i0_p4_ORF_typecomplete_len103_score0_93tRNAsynt_2/PF00152_20/0_011tRNA_lig_kinase/PF08303_11/0_033_NODE_362_length_3041_cov_3_336775_g341_i020742382